MPKPKKSNFSTNVKFSFPVFVALPPDTHSPYAAARFGEIEVDIADQCVQEFVWLFATRKIFHPPAKAGRHPRWAPIRPRVSNWVRISPTTVPDTSGPSFQSNEQKSVSISPGRK